MIKFKSFLLNEYKDKPIHIKRKAFYTIIFAVMILVYVASAAVIDIAIGKFTTIKMLEFGILIFSIFICYILFQFGHIEAATNLLCAMGLLRTAMTVFSDRSNDHMLIVTLLVILVAAVIHVKKYQIVLAYLFVLGIYVHVSMGHVLAYINESEPVDMVAESVYQFIGLLIFMAMCGFVIKIIDAEINRSTELEAARTTSIMYVGELEKLSNDLERMAVTDKLTGILNRRKFHEILTAEMDKSDRYNRPLAVLMMDLDHFKNVNDRFGHLQGDDTLKEFVALVNDNIRKTDTFIRWGGEEFVIISPELDIEQAKVFGEKIRLSVELYEFATVEHMTVSVGVVEYNQKETIDELIRRLDDCMYHAKNSGRNNVCSLCVTAP